jgi:hypothetical protein
VPALSEAVALYVGGQAVLRVEVDGVQVWPVSAPAGTYADGLLRITATHGGTVPRIAHVEFRAAVGGVALDGSAFASSEGSTQTAASKAFDGDAATHWEPALGHSDSPHVGRAFVGASAIAEVAITFANTEPLDTSGSPLDFQIIGRTGSTDTTLLSVTGALAWSPGETRTFAL